jgi:hypothetical protein
VGPEFHAAAQLSGNAWTSPDGDLSIHLVYDDYDDALYSTANCELPQIRNDFLNFI